ncbi:hypothetical protein JG687_00008584 [Phytophthora cactorum]|uniref:Uncharacterized protein n=1 Tax=Phytophthora cactorum TaxID=29920 RepID=A0A8T1UDX3_9STRA|nr:hypothetical protein JG687_00008584 [Phytophthora cactorum]
MNRKLAFDNRLCYERDVLRQQARHQRKLEQMVPTCHSPSKVYLDSNAPAPHPHLATNAKRQQMERDRQLDIYHQNQRLANKMVQIMNRQENIVLAASSRSRLAQRSHSKPGRGDACKKSTLVNRAVQKRRQNAIDQENRRLKERLAHLKPYYNTKKWDGEWQQHAHKFSHMHQDASVVVNSGLMIHGSWKDNVFGELLVNHDTLVEVAQIVDDLEIM